MNAPLSSYPNDSYHLGVNLRESRLDIHDWYATYLENLDITIKGIRSKRKEPASKAIFKSTASSYVNGLTSFVDTDGVPWVVGTVDGKVYRWDGTANATVGNGKVVEYDVHLPDTSHHLLHTTNPIRFARANNTLYFVDGSAYLCKFSVTSGTGSASVVTGAAQNTAIEAGSVVFSNGTTGDNVTDPDADGKLYQTQSGVAVEVGFISYTTGVYYFIGTFPWASGTVTCAYDVATVHAAETLTRAAQDGTLQFPCLLHAPIKAASLTLSDGSKTLTSNSTDYSDQGNYPGWKQILDDTTEVGGYDPTTGKFIVTTASTFAASTAITAGYVYGSAEVANESLVWSEDHGQGAVWEYQGIYGDYCSGTWMSQGSNGVVPGSITLDLGDIGTFVDDGAGSITTWGATVDYDTKVISQVGISMSPTTSGTPTATYSYWTTEVSASPGEAVGTSDADGKLYRFRTGETTIAAYTVTISQGSTVITGIPTAAPADNLYNGNTAVGEIGTDGVIVVNTASQFTAGSTPSIVYYTASAATPAAITFGRMAGSIGGLIPYGAQDILWWNNRLWLTGDNSLQFSDAYAPETFSELPLSVSATGKLKLLGYSYNRLYLFNAEAGALGEIFYVDVSGGTPSAWKAVSLYAGLNLSSTDCIIRAATNDSSDIFFRTQEGWRSLKTTQQDAVSGPSLPIDSNIRSWDSELNKNSLSSCWSIVFNDELLTWHPKTGSTTPSLVFAYNMNIPRQTIQDGWTRIDMPSSTGVIGIESHCGCVADFGAGDCLYIGSVTGGKVIQMFSAHAANHTATEISKGITFATPESPSMRFCAHSPRKLFVRTGPDSAASAVINAILVDDQGTEYALGSKTIEASGIVNHVKCFDATYATGATMAQRIPPSKDWRVKLTTTGDVQIQGYELEALSFKPAFVQLDESNVSGAVADTSLLETAVADTAL